MSSVLVLILVAQAGSGFGSAPAQAEEKTCDGRCPERRACGDGVKGVCNDCGRQNTECAHVHLCKDCAAKKGVCALCLKPVKDPARVKAQALLKASLPAHTLGRESPIKLADLKFFLVLHSGSPCKDCPQYLEPLVAVDAKTGEGRVLRSEKELAEYVRGRIIKDVSVIAELVQALWEPIHGGLEKKGEREFEFKKGHAYWKLSIELREDGTFNDLKTEYTGRSCR